MNKAEKLAIISRTTTAVVYSMYDEYTADLGWNADGTVEVMDHAGNEAWANALGAIGEVITNNLLDAKPNNINEFSDEDEVWTHSMDIDDIEVDGFQCYAVVHFGFQDENFLEKDLQ